MDKLTDMATMYSEWVSTFAALAGEFLPKLVMAIIIWFITWIVAKFISKWIWLLGTKLGLDKIAETAKIGGFLRDSNLGTLSNVLAKIVYWVIYFIGIIMVFDTLWLTVVSDLISNLVSYIPNLFVAVLIILVGAFIANFVKDLINGTVKWTGSKISWAGQAGYIAVMFLTIVTALEQAQVDISFLTDNVNTIVMGIMLALWLAFGLGGKDKARDMLEKMM